jgi:hypothetical protein
MKKNTMSAADVPLVRNSGGRKLMGVPWMVTVHAATAAAGERGVAAALDEVERLEAIHSHASKESSGPTTTEGAGTHQRQLNEWAPPASH